MLKYILVGILAVSGYYAWTIYPIKHGPGVITPDKPTISYSSWDKPFNLKGNTLDPIKTYSAQVRILKHKRYFFDDRTELSPVDILVGWDEMSDERNIEFVQFSLSERSFELNYTKPPIPESTMFKQMELLHLIPSTKEIDDRIKKLRSGNVIEIEGKLVDVESTENFNWTNDLLLSNSKNSNHLILWVENLEIQ